MLTLRRRPRQANASIALALADIAKWKPWVEIRRRVEVPGYRAKVPGSPFQRRVMFEGSTIPPQTQ
jgi:hypothetical protein